MLVKSQIKYIQSLGQKKFREEERVFVAEGPKIIKELLKCKTVRPVSVFATSEWLEEMATTGNNLVDGWTSISGKELERISFLATPNKALAIFTLPSFVSRPAEGVLLGLDGIRDPGNLGTLLRIADWFGIQQVYCSPETADIFNPKTVQSTMGSIARVEVIYGSLEEHIATMPGLPVYAATLEGENVYTIGRITNGMILIGNESRGINPALFSFGTRRITIPGTGDAESLNAAVAAGIILSHMVVQ